MKFPLVWGYPYPRSAIESCRSPAWCGALLLVLDPSRPPKQTRPRPQDSQCPASLLALKRWKYVPSGAKKRPRGAQDPWALSFLKSQGFMFLCFPAKIAFVSWFSFKGKCRNSIMSDKLMIVYYGISKPEKGIKRQVLGYVRCLFIPLMNHSLWWGRCEATIILDRRLASAWESLAGGARWNPREPPSWYSRPKPADHSLINGVAKQKILSKMMVVSWGTLKCHVTSIPICFVMPEIGQTH